MKPPLQNKNASELAASQQVHLLVDRSWASGSGLPVSAAPGRMENQLQCLPVPADPSELVVAPNGEVRFVEASSDAMAPSLIVEQVFNVRQQPRLLVINSAIRPLQLNGQSAPRLAVLKEKDVFQLNGGSLFHVSILNRPMIGSPRADRVGTECPVCRVPLAGDAVCYTCPCGVALHCESTPDGLQCAQLRSECPRCGRHVNLQKGFTYWPEGDHE